MNIKNDFSLKKFNTFGIDAIAKHFVELTTIEEVSELFQNRHFKSSEKLVLGSGSNLLFTKDYNGLIIKAKIGGIHVVKEDENFFWVKAGAGIIWQQLVQSCIKANFGGIENLSLIPGTVGAAPVQNIGAYGVEIKDCFEALEAVNLENDEKKYFKNHECNFEYRNSIFKNELKDKYLITNVVLRLTKQPIINIKYGNIQTALEELGKYEYSIKDVSEAIIKIRQSKLPDPDKIGNAGSFFKNPVISHEQYAMLKGKFAEMPSYDQQNGDKKIPAAWLIDQCQLKGKEHKGAAIHSNQPLVLINKNNATGNDILELSKMIQQQVQQKFGIPLVPEVRIL